MIAGLIIAFIPCITVFIAMTVNIVKSAKHVKEMKAELKRFGIRA